MEDRFFAPTDDIFALPRAGAVKADPPTGGHPKGVALMAPSTAASSKQSVQRSAENDQRGARCWAQ
jgi:hypothetical protein